MLRFDGAFNYSSSNIQIDREGATENPPQRSTSKNGELNDVGEWHYVTDFGRLRQLRSLQMLATTI